MVLSICLFIIFVKRLWSQGLRRFTNRIIIIFLEGWNVENGAGPIRRGQPDIIIIILYYIM